MQFPLADPAHWLTSHVAITYGSTTQQQYNSLSAQGKAKRAAEGSDADVTGMSSSKPCHCGAVATSTAAAGDACVDFNEASKEAATAIELPADLAAERWWADSYYKLSYTKRLECAP